MAIFSLGNTFPTIDAQAWIDDSATVVGDVTIGSHSSVWPGARIRGDEAAIVIGESTNVQDNAVIHSDPGIVVRIGSGVTVAHGVILHGCTIGDNSLIGMGATIMNHSVIGKNTLVGAGTLIAENKTFPDGVLILGRPGRVVRELNAKEIAQITQNARHYVERKSDYEKSLRPVCRD